MNNDPLSLLLLPNPRHLTLSGRVLSLPDEIVVVLNSFDAQALRFAARELGRVLGDSLNLNASVATGVGPGEGTITLNIVPGSMPHPQGYEITITDEAVHLVASEPAGIFYAVQTLKQIVQQSGRSLPQLRIRDWPDFPNRGFMIDISRDKVPTMDTLYDLIDMLAGWKINQIQLYMEHTFAYRNHQKVWAEASPLTSEEILALDAFCQERFIELVPNQNSFGHMRRWLIHEEYAHMAECPDGCDTVWGWFDEPFSLYPAEPDSLKLVCELFDELLPHFSSRQFNVGLDETVDLGQGRSAALVAEKGVGSVYLDFLLQIYREVKSRGRTMQFWGDVLMNHPELVAQLPRDVIALEWGYEAGHPFDEHGAIFAASGIPYYVVPGTSSWNTVAGRTDNALTNLRRAAANGLKHGAIGYLNTDWGDNGHWQPLPVSFLPLAYGAAASWVFATNHDINITQAASTYAFQDDSGVLGQVAYDLGNIYQLFGYHVHNSSPLFNALQAKPDEIVTKVQGKLDSQEKLLPILTQIESQLDELVSGLAQANSQRADAELIQREFRWAAGIMRHGCHRIRWAMNPEAAKRDQLAADVDQLMAEYSAIWHARNRPGGFKDSVARMEKMKEAYAN